MRGLALCEQTVACYRHRHPSKPGLRTSELLCTAVRSGNGPRLLATPRCTGEAREYNTAWQRWQLPLELCDSIRRCDCESSRSRQRCVEVVCGQSSGAPAMSGGGSALLSFLELPRKPLANFRMRSPWSWSRRFHSPRLCRIAVFFINPTSLSPLS